MVVVALVSFFRNTSTSLRAPRYKYYYLMGSPPFLQINIEHFNPLNPSVSISILLNGCHKFVVALVGRSCSNNKRVHPWLSFP